MRLLLATIMLCVFAYEAHGQEHHHPPQDAQIHEKFYSTWMMPDHPSSSCCNKEDCYPTEARFKRGQWWARQRETGQWMRIPPEKVERDRDSPDARAHVCASKAGYVYCFVVGGGA